MKSLLFYPIYEPTSYPATVSGMLAEGPWVRDEEHYVTHSQGSSQGSSIVFVPGS